MFPKIRSLIVFGIILFAAIPAHAGGGIDSLWKKPKSADCGTAVCACMQSCLKDRETAKSCCQSGNSGNTSQGK